MCLNYVVAVAEKVSDDQCITEHPIKAYVVMQAYLNLLHLILYTSLVCVRARNKEPSICTSLLFCNMTLLVFLIGWMITGCIWVRGSLDEFDWQDAESICIALLISTIIYLILHFVWILLVLCCCCGYGIWLVSANDSEGHNTE